MEAQSRTLEEIKKEILRRSGRENPFERAKKEDVEEALGRLSSLEPDHWGAEWGKIGARYEALATEHEQKGQSKEAGILPDGGHMGRVPGQRNDEVLQVVTRWIQRRFTES